MDMFAHNMPILKIWALTLPFVAIVQCDKISALSRLRTNLVVQSSKTHNLTSPSQNRQTPKFSWVLQRAYPLVIYQYRDIIILVTSQSYYTSADIASDMPKVQVMGYRCLRCGHEWLPRKNSKGEPKVCPKCKSPYWNTPKRK